MNREETKFIVINDVQYRPNYRLWLSFNDGKKQVVDFEPFLKKSHHPEIQKYLDRKLFEQFTFKDGYVYWNDYDLCFSIEDMYEGKII